MYTYANVRICIICGYKLTAHLNGSHYYLKVLFLSIEISEINCANIIKKISKKIKTRTKIVKVFSGFIQPISNLISLSTRLWL